MRETQALFLRRNVWIALVAAGLVLGLAGPFGTVDEMRLAPRLIYWLIVAIVTFFSGSFTGSVMSGLLGPAGLPVWAVILIVGIAIGLVVTGEILALNWAAFGLSPTKEGYGAPLFLNAVAVSIIVTAALEFIDTGSPDTATDNAPALLSRLPFDKRGALVAISVSDHYVEVKTVKGRELLLMRLSDAIRETHPVEGLQVHRSHWVALDQVSSARRDGARGILTMSDGGEIPVSRTYLPAVRDAGLLPG